MAKGNKPERTVTLTIDSLSKKGNGLGTAERENAPPCIVEVPFAIPGDTVQVALTKKRGGIFTGLLREVITPSEHRIQPRCIHAGICGGCRWQQMDYQQQLREKEKVVRELLHPYITDKTTFNAIVACDPPWEYRNKMEFSFSSNRAGDLFLGLIMDSSQGKVLNLEVCHLVSPWFVEGLKAVRQWWQESGLQAYYPPKDTGTLRTLTCREGKRTGDRLVMLTVSGNPDYSLKEPHLESFVAFVRAAIEPIHPRNKLSIFLRIHQARAGMPTEFYEMQLYGPDHIREELTIGNTAYHFNISPSAFFQPNTQQAEKLYSLAVNMTQLPNKATVYDLYCGTGTLGICFAKRAQQVIGIELSPESSLDARTNAALNKLDNLKILTGDVGRVLEKIKEEQEYPLPDLVVLDPPRTGLDDRAIQHVIALQPPHILFISCNPRTQADNLAHLTRAGYYVDAVQPVDQFPHTAHIENIVYLKRNV